MNKNYLTEWKRYLSENTSDDVKITDLSKNGVIKYEISSLDKRAIELAIQKLNEKHPGYIAKVVASSIGADRQTTKTIIFKQGPKISSNSPLTKGMKPRMRGARE
jgi:hypothetical protein